MASSHRGQPLSVPQGPDDESHQTALFEPAQGELRAQAEEVAHLVQVERTLTGHRDEGCAGKTALSPVQLQDPLQNSLYVHAHSFAERVQMRAQT